MILSCKKLFVFFMAFWVAPLSCSSEGKREYEQIETLLNRLKCLELEKAKLQEGAWLVADKKAKKRLLIIIAAILALNVVVWGAVKLYYRLNKRKDDAIGRSREIQALTDHFTHRIQRQDGIIRQLRQERDDAVRDFNRVVHRLRQLHGRMMGGGQA